MVYESRKLFPRTPTTSRHNRFFATVGHPYFRDVAEILHSDEEYSLYSIFVKTKRRSLVAARRISITPPRVRRSIYLAHAGSLLIVSKCLESRTHVNNKIITPLTIPIINPTTAAIPISFNTRLKLFNFVARIAFLLLLFSSKPWIIVFL